jgi:cytochrome P450
MTTPVDLDAAGQALADPSAVADEDRFHRAAAVLREHSPVHLVHTERYPPFWAVLRHSDISDIERRANEFTNTDWSVLIPTVIEDAARSRGAMLHTLINMDHDEHRQHRAVTADWFSNRSLGRLEEQIRHIADATVERMRLKAPECDAAIDIAKPYPLHVIMSILGLPESDEPRMLQLTQELFGGDDDELQRSAGGDPMPIITDFAAYFDRITEQRRDCPADDLASVIANGTINGCPLGDRETMSYYVITATAGHDTTSAAIAGGIRVLAERPELVEQLKADATLISSFTDEIIRWVTPVKHFLRTSVNDTVVAGQRIRAGERLMMCYWSANRDETVFDEPFTFDPSRKPNRHLGFGIGPHFCLGAGLAKLEIRIFFERLLSSLRTVSLSGPVQNVRAVFVSGPKRVPIHYEFTT